MINIHGIVPLTTIDYPGCLAAVFFLQGCSWDCKYCHNSELQTFSRTTRNKSWEDATQFLKTRQGLLDAIVFSGGEPTAQKNLPGVMQIVKDLGFKVGLHTAGSHPEAFAKCLPFVDWVGFDVKAPLDERYDQITQVADSFVPVVHSLDLLLKSGVQYEIRTTIHPTLHTESDVDEINRYLLQIGATPTKIQEVR